MWTLNGNVLTAHKVEIGVSDGSRTEILSGLEEGTTVIQSFEIITETPPDKKGPSKKNDKENKK